MYIYMYICMYGMFSFVIFPMRSCAECSMGGLGP